MSKSFYKWVSFIVLFSSVFGFSGVFFYQFDGQFSRNQQDWGAFGSYISGTIGVLAACLAVIWLIRSVSIQQKELIYLKDELKNSFNEQKKQTHINALTAILNSKQQVIANDRSLLSELKNDYESGLIDNSDKGKTALIFHTCMIEYRINKTVREISFYEGQIDTYLSCKYVSIEGDGK